MINHTGKAMEDEIKKYLRESAELKNKMADKLAGPLEESINMIRGCFKAGGKILICGNGGSAADAQHFAAELVNKFKIDRVPLPAIALTTDSSILTSIGNDSGFDYVYAKQVQAFGKEGDILIVITTSDITFDQNGHSTNIALSLKAGKEKKMKIIGLVSQKSQRILDFLDLALIVPHNETPRIQEGHITLLHIICEIVEKRIFNK